MPDRRRWRADVLPQNSARDLQTSSHSGMDVVPATPWLRRLRDVAVPDAHAGQRKMSVVDGPASSQATGNNALGRPIAEDAMQDRLFSTLESMPVRDVCGRSSGNDAARSSTLCVSSESAQTKPGKTKKSKNKSEAKPKSHHQQKFVTRWGRCDLCQRALVPRIRHSDGKAFLSCPRWPWCTFARSVPLQLEPRLTARFLVRRRVDF
jgi:hypothetical protein